jgi:hypothetical protein
MRATPAKRADRPRPRAIVLSDAPAGRASTPRSTARGAAARHDGEQVRVIVSDGEGG